MATEVTQAMVQCTALRGTREAAKARGVAVLLLRLVKIAATTLLAACTARCQLASWLPLLREDTAARVILRPAAELPRLR